MGLLTFFSDGDASPTPFNQFNKKKKQAKKVNDDGSYNIDMVSAADTIQGLSQKNARMWQIIALVSLSSFIISLFICFYAVRLPKTIPVIVTVDTDGNATYVGKVDKSSWGKTSIPEIHKTSQIKKLVSNMFTWVIDYNAQNQYLQEAQNICQGAALNQLDTFIRANNPFDWLGVKTQTVSCEEPLKQTNTTYVIYFNVNTYQNGHLTQTRRFSLLATIGYFEVTEKTKDLNPLGVYITSFDLKEVIKN